MSWNNAIVKLPELFLFGRFPYNFDGIPLVADNLSFKKKMNILRCGIDDMLKSVHSHGLPPVIKVEPTNICNLKCPLCPTGSGASKRPKGFMPFKTMKRILDELEDALISVLFYGWGEPFLNRELPRMIEACTTRNIFSITSSNGHCLQTLDEALEIVDAGLTVLIIAIDGSTQEIYQSYRKGGDIEKVKRCAALIEEAKSQRGSRFPYTNLRSLAVQDNMEDFPNIERLARELGVDIFSYKSVATLTAAGKFEDYEPSEKHMRRYEYEGTVKRKLPPIQCSYPFRQPTVFWDGTIVGCEFDNDLEIPLGKVGVQSFLEIWNGSAAVRLRSLIRRGPTRPDFCTICPFQDRIQDSCVLSVKFLSNNRI